MIGLTKFSAQPEEDKKGAEVYHRLLSIFGKNRYGYHTRFMSDFELFLESILNEKFIDTSTLYYDDPNVTKEIEDQEAGLMGDFSDQDVKHLLHDRSTGSHDHQILIRYPGRAGDNYDLGDQLSCYKILPKKE